MKALREEESRPSAARTIFPKLVTAPWWVRVAMPGLHERYSMNPDAMVLECEVLKKRDEFGCCLKD